MSWWAVAGLVASFVLTAAAIERARRGVGRRDQ
jgi:hypothetical protein